MTPPTTRPCSACYGVGMTEPGDLFEPWVRCRTCNGRGSFVVALSDLATTTGTRRRLRGQTWHRHGHPLSPRGQKQLLHKQERQNQPE